ncbi:uncharacterized protein LOC126740817 [Anthonomus grandis grandis]|uniref:uncharacterized protein LOC126740817 n=1 Tax=Anthonomus grandis grandis TaxID=2921223 RepID=UPI00216667F6|nr:uncharacterized protein LOC126740817 [Anthonomus grandis grandis]
MDNTCILLVLSTLLVSTHCRPEGGYQYPPQQQHHGFPTPQTQQSVSNYLPPNPTFPHSPLDLQNHLQLPFQHQPSGAFNPQQPFNQIQLLNPLIGNPQIGFNPAQNHLLAPQNGFNIPQGHPVVTKHVYVHIAPEEPQSATPQTPASLPLPPQKHYKIIFIKAPAQQGAQRQIVHPPVAQQTVEEKTLIYVLVNKAKQPEIVVPPPAPTQPSKPEVYFIKYKANNGPLVEDLKKGGQPENSGESTSSLFSGGAEGPRQGGVSSHYGPPGYAKRSA